MIVSAAILASPLALAPQAVSAQGTDDHADGEHGEGEGQGHGSEGGHGQGGHGQGGHGQGGHTPGTTQVVAVPPDTGHTASPSSRGAAAFGSGSFVRLELGSGRYEPQDASWLPPGYPQDPQVFFDIDDASAAYGAMAIGRSFGNNWRGELALTMFGRTDFSGPWSYTVPDDPGPHANVSGSIRSTAIMANGYYDFDLSDKVRPFVTAGLGLSHNAMGDWTRINPDSDRTSRSFEGDDKTSFAWSVGFGVSLDAGPVIGKNPAQIEIAWRYFDLGSASGRATPLPGSGSGGNPVEPLNFDVTNQVISIGLRIPLD